MEKLLLILLFFMSFAVAKAQDKIITVRKDTIECRIISVGGERINYEQKTSESHVVGKSIAISDVHQYFRAGKPGALDSFDRQKITRQKPERRYLFTIQGGLARSFTDFDSFKNMMTGAGVSESETDNYTGKLKNGYHINAGFHYLMTSFLGVGADYSLFYSASEGNFLINGYGGMNIPMYVNMELNEKIYTHFIGPSVLFQQFADRKRKIKITETLSPGIIMFRNEKRGNEYQIFWDNYDYDGEPPQYYNNANAVTKSTAFGAKAGLSLEYCISPQLSAGVAGNFIWAKLQKVSFKGFNNDMEDQKLEKALNVSHVDYGFIIRYNF